MQAPALLAAVAVLGTALTLFGSLVYFGLPRRPQRP
jgi:hypothetical protein